MSSGWNGGCPDITPQHMVHGVIATLAAWGTQQLAISSWNFLDWFAWKYLSNKRERRQAGLAGLLTFLSLFLLRGTFRYIVMKYRQKIGYKDGDWNWYHIPKEHFHPILHKEFVASGALICWHGPTNEFWFSPEKAAAAGLAIEPPAPPFEHAKQLGKILSLEDSKGDHAHAAQPLMLTDGRPSSVEIEDLDPVSMDSAMKNSSELLTFNIFGPNSAVGTAAPTELDAFFDPCASSSSASSIVELQ